MPAPKWNWTRRSSCSTITTASPSPRLQQSSSSSYAVTWAHGPPEPRRSEAERLHAKPVSRSGILVPATQRGHLEQAAFALYYCWFGERGEPRDGRSGGGGGCGVMVSPGGPSRVAVRGWVERRDSRSERCGRAGVSRWRASSSRWGQSTLPP
jgi:hypothetical protein